MTILIRGLAKLLKYVKSTKQQWAEARDRARVSLQDKVAEFEGALG